MSPKIKIILIEDHALIMKFLKTFIERLDYDIVAEAKCGREALEVIKNIPADLILLDLSLPHVTGLQILIESKKIRPTKVLIITMNMDSYIIQEALDAGADGICLKDRCNEVLENAMLETLAGKHPVYLEG